MDGQRGTKVGYSMVPCLSYYGYYSSALVAVTNSQGYHYFSAMAMGKAGFDLDGVCHIETDSCYFGRPAIQRYKKEQ